MPTPPAPAEHEIISAINARISEVGELSELDFIRFGRDAEALVPDPNGFAALGILACLKGDEVEMRRQHALAIRYAGGASALQISNYANSLFRMGFLDEAFEQALAAWHSDPAETNALSIAIAIAYKAGDDERLEPLLEAWRDCIGEPHMAENFKDMDNLSADCAASSEAALAEVWDCQEEDEAWAHLQ